MMGIGLEEWVFWALAFFFLSSFLSLSEAGGRRKGWEGNATLGSSFSLLGPFRRPMGRVGGGRDSRVVVPRRGPFPARFSWGGFFVFFGVFGLFASERA